MWVGVCVCVFSGGWQGVCVCVCVCVSGVFLVVGGVCVCVCRSQERKGIWGFSGGWRVCVCVCVCVCEGHWLILAIKCKGMGSMKDSWEATTGKR